MPPSNYIPFKHLDAHHLDALRRAISNILATDLALTTFAQIIDGLPLYKVAWDKRTPLLHRQHPINHHITLCSGVLEKAREIRANFNLDTLTFKPEVCRLRFFY
jgi:hypothetical protein